MHYDIYNNGQTMNKPFLVHGYTHILNSKAALWFLWAEAKWGKLATASCPAIWKLILYLRWCKRGRCRRWRDNGLWVVYSTVPQHRGIMNHSHWLELKEGHRMCIPHTSPCPVPYMLIPRRIHNWCHLFTCCSEMCCCTSVFRLTASLLPWSFLLPEKHT